MEMHSGVRQTSRKLPHTLQDQMRGRHTRRWRLRVVWEACVADRLSRICR